MAEPSGFQCPDIDSMLSDTDVLKRNKEISDLAEEYVKSDFQAILKSSHAREVFKQTLENFHLDEISSNSVKQWPSGFSGDLGCARALLIGLAAFNAFLQANVTGPPLSTRSLLFNEDLSFSEISSQRRKCLTSLEIDGLSVYQHIPHVELFCLARAIFTQYFPQVINMHEQDSKWMRMRINVYHQRLLSSGTSNTRLSDSAMGLQTQIEADMLALENKMMSPESNYSTEAKVQFLLEKASICIMQGLDVRARENVHLAKNVSGFSYALSGALGKRTKFQQKDISQLVVFAKSNGSADGGGETQEEQESNGLTPSASHIATADSRDQSGPIALELNDDTLLEAIEFTKSAEKDEKSTLSPELAELTPEKQPQLNPLDQIILLTEATLKDTLSPLDKLNSQEILPFAVRVLNDKPTNWQIYTQALLVRSRIEAHRSRTLERSVLQLQVIVDQIIADTQEEPKVNGGDTNGVPEIRVTQFLPKAKPLESASVRERLKYVNQLNTPTRWEIETELAYAWSNAGSLISALEIFKRLQLWAEVALCYHSVSQEDKARQIVRRQLYMSSKGPEMDHFSVDAAEVVTEQWDGEMRTPPPPHAPRLWCILGDLEQDPSCWQRAWEISKHRYARAQRTLGEYWTRNGDLGKAREAYIKATVVNRQNNETWSRLGDIDLRVGNWDGAIIAFQQSIMIDDSDAKTYSNLGSALLSKHAELVEFQKDRVASEGHVPHDNLQPTPDDEGQSSSNHTIQESTKPQDLLHQALRAYQRGASIAYSNWQIWDNVLTIATRMTPPSYPSILHAFRSIIQIRAPTIGEAAIDIAVLRALVREVITHEKPATTGHDHPAAAGIYEPPRGSLARAVVTAVDADVVPLITTRSALWSLVEKLRLYCRDYAGALECAEKAWRIATTMTTTAAAGGEAGWLESEDAWKEVAAATDGLVSAYENYGPQERAGGLGMVEKGWRVKARSAVRGVIGKARDVWGDTEEFKMLEGRLEELKI